MRFSTAAALAALVLVDRTTAHSWVEELDLIDPQTGMFMGTPGYCRNNTKHTAPGFSDPLMVHILPSLGQPSIEERDQIPALDTTGISPNDPMCKHTQQTQFQSDGNPRLQATPGSLVALRYQENGHVTLPQNQLGKPANRGTVYIYGTTQPKFPEKLLDIFGQWNEAGTGGDGRGKLLATQPFDDGYCYQKNAGNISTIRQAKYPHTSDPLMGADLWCQNDIALPTDIPEGSPYTLMWIWDWPTLPGVDPNLPKGKAELYTTCMDIDIVAKPGSKRRVKARQAPSPPPTQASPSAMSHLNSAAIPAYVSSLTASPAPAGASPVVSAKDSAASPESAPAGANPVVSAKDSAASASPAPAGASPVASAKDSAASPESKPTYPAVQAGDSNSTMNAVPSYIENAVSAAIAAQVSNVPLTITVDVVEATVSPMTGAVATTQLAGISASTPVASPPAVAPVAIQAASPAASPASNLVASPANNTPAANQAASQAPASTPPTVSTSMPAQAPAPAPSSMPPKSLNINPPVLSAPSSPNFSGTATPVVPSAVVANSAVASAASQNGTAAAKGPRGCTAKTCKSKRQSRIFAKKNVGQRL